MKEQDQYGEPIIIHSENAVIRIRKPILTEEERERRFANLKKECSHLMRTAEEIKRKESTKSPAV